MTNRWQRNDGRRIRQSGLFSKRGMEDSKSFEPLDEDDDVEEPSQMPQVRKEFQAQNDVQNISRNLSGLNVNARNLFKGSNEAYEFTEALHEDGFGDGSSSEDMEPQQQKFDNIRVMKKKRNFGERESMQSRDFDNRKRVNLRDRGVAVEALRDYSKQENPRTFEEDRSHELKEDDDDYQIPPADSVPDVQLITYPNRRPRGLPNLQIDNMRPRTEDFIEEVEFIFNGTIEINGFQISKAGIQQLPENLEPYQDRDYYDDVPSSTRKIFVVKHFSELELGEKLGNGSSGYVMLAKHKASKTLFAVKVVNVHNSSFRDQVEKELRLLMTHKNAFLVRLFQAFYNGAASVHLVLEYMDAGSIQDVVNSTGAIAEPVMRTVALHCLRALRSLHDSNILHRDIKSANILLSASSKRAKLSDFGLSKEVNATQGAANTYVGTLAYMSPERLNGEPYKYHSDVWGLGITLVEGLLGEHPFKNHDDFHRYTENDYIRLDRSKFSEDACDFIKLCTYVKPKKRPCTEELLNHPWVTKVDSALFGQWLQNVHERGKQATKKEGLFQNFFHGIPSRNILTTGP
eukprot:Plantae.Rhodophyta-Purpureofilum_apyrenoidigerum.ctg3402.p1 GENE.Plantae.Rhodophyta-Purpureofilum_apyrenoidigerum.ctg3402~~Plantae.Rhodophyta-Purpureofilum_apyrenoidigerum.ctg3402.p1  ORF type:complete len:573 (-),score=136.70 Plantae.Rhodophyta-Purpureofilum_apyrenoidigerum.ctg3402:971-2689(-)